MVGKVVGKEGRRSIGGTPAVAGTLLLGAYALGLTGWVWDYLEHMSGGEPVAAHLLMYAALLVVLAVTVVRVVRGTVAFGRAAAGAAGWLVVGVGVVVDLVWHRAHPGSMGAEENMILLPGHQIELAGWAIGVLIVGYLLLFWRRALAGRSGEVR